MATTPGSTTRLTSSEVLDRVRGARAEEQAAGIAQIELIAQWALLNPCPDDEWPAHWGEPGLFAESVTPLAGVGAPVVREFATAELGAALGISLHTARQHVGDALELVFRLPQLWCHVKAGRVPLWRAREISRETHDLGPEAVAYADRLLAAIPDRLNQVNAARLVAEARLYYDPDRAVAEEEEELARRGVWVKHRGNPATTDVVMTLDTMDAQAFHEVITILAAELAAHGDTSDVETRRAKAVGILADPKYALDLLTLPRGGTPTPGTTSGNINLFVHLTPEDLEPHDPDTSDSESESESGTGAASIEKLGAATTALLHDWLTTYAARGGKVTLRPILDLNNDRAVDQHDPPSWLREQVLQSYAFCVFPGCTRDSRGCDLDHIIEYLPMDQGGPPGQTRAENLAPLCRTHHRVKTFTAWHYKRLDDGTHIWTAPDGHQYEVHASPRRPPQPPARRA